MKKYGTSPVLLLPCQEGTIGIGFSRLRVNFTSESGKVLYFRSFYYPFRLPAIKPRIKLLEKTANKIMMGKVDKQSARISAA
jgi:hypothetical protein